MSADRKRLPAIDDGPLARVGYALADEHHSSAGANLPQIIEDVGKSQNVPVIDLTTLSWNWLQTAIRGQKLELAQYLR